jgi:hypothetical protein
MPQRCEQVGHTSRTYQTVEAPHEPLARHGGISRRCAVDIMPARRQHMTFILWLIAVILVIAGIVAILRSQVLMGIVLIIVGLLVGPGGVSIFR